MQAPITLQNENLILDTIKRRYFCKTTKAILLSHFGSSKSVYNEMSVINHGQLSLYFIDGREAPYIQER